MSLSFNLQKAMEATRDPKLVGTSSRHICAKSVRQILERGGLNTDGRPGHARQYVNYLPTIGFQLLKTITGPRNITEEFTKTEAKPGDIAVYKKPGNPTASGHICIYNGSEWVSDFRQNNMNVYSAPITAYIYRWNGEVNYNITLPPEPTLGIGLSSGGSLLGSSGSGLSGNSIFSSASNNAMSLTTYIPNTDDENTKHTRIYSASERTIVLDELSMPLDDRIISLDNGETENRNLPS